MNSFIALHGFLGLPSDWAGWKVIPYLIKPADSLNAWAKEFNKWAEANTTAPRHLVGYSMGGRLGLHALIQNPTLWQGATFISTNIVPKDSFARLQNDYAWAAKFRAEPWDKLMKEWESQAVFKGSFTHARYEKDYNREELALCLENFSLAKHEDLFPAISKISIPIQWITGALDLTAVAHAEEVIAKHLLSTHQSIPNGTHRVHFEYPESLKIGI